MWVEQSPLPHLSSDLPTPAGVGPKDKLLASFSIPTSHCAPLDGLQPSDFLVGSCSIGFSKSDGTGDVNKTSTVATVTVGS